MKNPIPLNKFMQIVIVVDDIERSLDAWCDVFGVQRPDIIIREAVPHPVEKYRGEPANYGLKIAIIDVPGRDFIMELHEPDDNPSTFREFLDNHGNGVHHIGFVVGDRRDAIVADLVESGYELRVDGARPGAGWTVIDSEATLGVNVNVKPLA